MLSKETSGCRPSFRKRAARGLPVPDNEKSPDSHEKLAISRCGGISAAESRFEVVCDAVWGLRSGIILVYFGIFAPE